MSLSSRPYLRYVQTCHVQVCRKLINVTSSCHVHVPFAQITSSSSCVSLHKLILSANEKNLIRLKSVRGCYPTHGHKVQIKSKRTQPLVADEPDIYELAPRPLPAPCPRRPRLPLPAGSAAAASSTACAAAFNDWRASESTRATLSKNTPNLSQLI